MNPMFLPDVEALDPPGEIGDKLRQMRAAGLPIPQIWHLIAFKPQATRFLGEFTQQVMRGPSPLSPGQRELIAAFTSSQNACPF